MKMKDTLRVLGTSVTMMESIRAKAEEDLGIHLEYHVHDTETAQRLAVTRPDLYDLYDHSFHNIDFVWPAGSIQPIDTTRLLLWDEINDLPKKGRLSESDRLASGSLPCDRLFVQHDGSLSSRVTSHISMLPLAHNADSFAYIPELLPAGLAGKEESWAWLVDDRWRGHVALQNDAAIGALDAALAVQAGGLASFETIGNLQLDEINRLAEVLIEKQRLGHFSAFWKDDNQAGELMLGQGVYIESLWGPTVMRLHRAGINYKLARPKEGYRAWLGGLSLSKCAEGKAKDVAYEYMNWWLSGWAGAVIARHGFYMSAPNRVKLHLTQAEWDFWYGGLPAAEQLLGSDGLPLIDIGQTREGGSYESRMGHIAVWNAVMDEHNYLVRKWTDVLRAGARPQSGK